MTMKLGANLSDLFFARLDNIVLDMFSGSLGFTADGNVYTYVDGTVVSNPLTETAMGIPGFAMRVTRDKLKVGDIVVQRPGKNAAGSLAFVSALPTAESKTVTLTNASGVEFTLGATRNVLFGGTDTVMAISSPLSDAFSGSEAGMGGMNPLMLMALMGDKEGGKGTDLMKLALFSQMGNAGAGGMNPLMLMALMDK